MSKDNNVITRICFKRDLQLLSDTAASHKRNLLIFSSTSIAIIFLSWMSEREKLSSVFGVRFDDNIPILYVVIVLLFPTIYELIQFILHCKTSTTVYKETIEKEQPEMKSIEVNRLLYQNDNILKSLHTDLNINLDSDFYHNMIKTIENRYTPPDLTLDRMIVRFDCLTKEIDNIIEIVNQNHPSLAQINDSLDKIKKNIYADNFSTLAAAKVEHYRSIQIVHSMHTADFNKNLSLNILLNKLSIIIENQVKINESSKELNRILINTSMAPKDQYLMEIYLPLFVSFVSFCCCIAYIFLSL